MWYLLRVNLLPYLRFKQTIPKRLMEHYNGVASQRQKTRVRK